jgi:hypothetical protein
MGRGKKMQDAKDALFKRLYGVKPDSFNKMLSILQKEFRCVKTRQASQTDTQRQAIY